MKSKLYFVSKNLSLKEANEMAFIEMKNSDYQGEERLSASIKWSCGTNLILRHKNYWIYYFD